MPQRVQFGRKAQFSSFEFDTVTGVLTREGIRLRLESQPAKVLELLVAAQGDLISRAELIRALWPGEVEGNFDRRLDKAVAKLRACLNEDPAKPIIIETLKGRGYRFLARVTFGWTGADPGQATQTAKAALSNHAALRLAGTEAQAVAPIPPSLQKLFPSLLSHRWFAATGLVVVAACLLGWWLHGKLGAHARNHTALLMLGFRNASASAENAWISHSIEEWLSADLAEGGELQIQQGGTSPELRRQAPVRGCGELPTNVLETARRAFNADRVVYGDYSSAEEGTPGERWQLNVCLANTEGRGSPESMAVVGSNDDIAQLVTNAADLLRSRLGLKHLSSQTMGYLRATLPVSQAAARLYAEGTSALEHFQPQEASVLLTEAARLEPQHAPTHAALSTAWAALGYQKLSQQEALLARDLAKNLSPAQKLEYEGLAAESNSDWAGAVDTYRKLLQLYPDSVDHGLKLANAQVRASQAKAALQTLRSLRLRNPAALNDPRCDLAEAAADAALSDYQAELAASTQAEVHATAQDSELLVANARMGQGDADDKLDNWDEALRLWRLAGKSYESLGDRGGMADALNHQGVLAWNKDDSETATKLFEQAMRLSTSIGDQSGIAYSLSRLGDLHLYVDPAHGRGTSAALELFRKAAAIYHETENEAEEGNILSLFGDEAMVRSQCEEAKGFYLKAMALSQAAHDQSRIANRLLDLGNVAGCQGQVQAAEQYLGQSAEAYQALGQQDRVAIARDCLAGTLLLEGKIDQAAPLLEDSLASLRLIGRRMQVFEVRWDLIRLEMVRNPARAEALARENIELSKIVGRVGPSGDPSAYAVLAEAEARQGKLKEAQQDILQAFAPGEPARAKSFLPEMLLARGYVSMSRKNWSSASTDFENALTLTRSRGRIYLEMESRLALAELHVRQHGSSSLPELDSVKHDALKLGYGIVPIKIEAFLHSISS